MFMSTKLRYFKDFLKSLLRCKIKFLRGSIVDRQSRIYSSTNGDLSFLFKFNFKDVNFQMEVSIESPSCSSSDIDLLIF